MYEYKKGYWETKNHRVIKICDMKTSHIENTIKFLKKHTDFYDEYYGIANDWDSYDYEDNSHLVDKKIEELQKELDRRLNK